MLKKSVIISVYNTQLYLEEYLDSVVNQVYKDIEIICIDNIRKITVLRYRKGSIMTSNISSHNVNI